MTNIAKMACVGGGVIGAGWAARFASNGIDVAIFDPDPQADRKVREVLANAERAQRKLTLAPGMGQGSVTVTADLAEALDGAQFVQESVPEREDLKRRTYGDIERHIGDDVLICSSTSGLRPSDLQADMTRPERLLVGHPFNPVYLLPLVELVGGDKTAPGSIDRAREIYASLGMHPLHVRKEIEAFVADRLQEALWREALWLVHDDVATTSEIDDAVRYGCGLRWAQMGTFQTFWLAGGEGGMRHMLAQFGPALKWPWTKLMDVPELTDAFVEKIASQCDAQAAGASPREMERVRDDCLVAIMQALKTQEWGAGETLRAYDQRLYERAHSANVAVERDFSKPIRMHETIVQPDWTDYNNHMNEARYLQVFCDSTDAFLPMIGVDQDYVAGGNSYYTVETHIRHLQEVAGLEPLYVMSQLVGYDEKRIHMFQWIHHGRTNEVLATGEQMFLHVDAKASRACSARPEVLGKLGEIWQGHQHLERPEGAGRSIGIKPKT